MRLYLSVADSSRGVLPHSSDDRREPDSFACPVLYTATQILQHPFVIDRKPMASECIWCRQCELSSCCDCSLLAGMPTNSLLMPGLFCGG